MEKTIDISYYDTELGSSRKLFQPFQPKYKNIFFKRFSENDKKKNFFLVTQKKN